MLPISSEYMGNEPGRISVRFHNGVEVVDGFLVEQTGTSRYVVSDGENEFVVQLARTLAAVDSLAPGKATIFCYPLIDGVLSETAEHIKTLTAFTCYTVEGHRYGWRMSRADQPGECDIARIPHQAE